MQRLHELGWGTRRIAAEVGCNRETVQRYLAAGACPPFRQLRELTRRVQTDACVDVDTNHYSVPWKLIGAEVSVTVDGGQVRIHHAGLEVACHAKRLGRRERCVDRAHLHGVVPSRPDPANDIEATAATVLPSIELLRSLAEYEQVTGGGW